MGIDAARGQGTRNQQSRRVRGRNDRPARQQCRSYPLAKCRNPK
jgi:hypothetical protein